MNRLLLAAIFAALGLSACAKQEEAAAPAEAPKPVATAPASFPPNSGNLVQVLHAGGYTYGEVEGPQGQRVWVAGGHIDAQPGDMVQWGQFAVMNNFTAKSLNRSFEQILFVNSWGPVGGTSAAVAAHGAPPSAAAGAAPAADAHAGIAGHGGSGIVPAAVPERSGVVKTATTAAGYTYLEVAQGETTVWVAAPETTVKEGDQVSWGPGMVMRNFTAKSINRTFDQIIFARAVAVQP